MRLSNLFRDYIAPRRKGHLYKSQTQNVICRRIYDNQLKTVISTTGTSELSQMRLWTTFRVCDLCRRPLMSDHKYRAASYLRHGVKKKWIIPTDAQWVESNGKICQSIQFLSSFAEIHMICSANKYNFDWWNSAIMRNDSPYIIHVCINVTEYSIIRVPTLDSGVSLASYYFLKRDHSKYDEMRLFCTNLIKCGRMMFPVQ